MLLVASIILSFTSNKSRRICFVGYAHYLYIAVYIKVYGKTSMKYVADKCTCLPSTNILYLIVYIKTSDLILLKVGERGQY